MTTIAVRAQAQFRSPRTVRFADFFERLRRRLDRALVAESPWDQVPARSPRMRRSEPEEYSPEAVRERLHLTHPFV